MCIFNTLRYRIYIAYSRFLQFILYNDFPILFDNYFYIINNFIFSLWLTNECFKLAVLIFIKKIDNLRGQGGYSLIGRASDCDSEGYRFKSYYCHLTFDFILLNDYMVYNNSFDFILKVMGKDFPIKILQTSKLIECHYSCIEYTHKNKFIDVNLKLAMKHFLIQTQVDYLDSICNKQNLTTHDLGFFTNMFVLRGLTSAPSIDLLNIENNKFEKIKTIFFSDKMVCGAIGNQYLSPITSFLFTEDWSKLSKVHKYEKILDYDKNFNLKNLSDINALAEAIWEDKVFSNEYNSFDNFLIYFKELLQQQYWIHNYGGFKIYKTPQDYVLYPEIYQILYNLNFEFIESSKQSKIYFDSLFFDKSLIAETDLSEYKNIENFKDQLVNWRNEGKIIEFKKNLLSLGLLHEKYNLDDFLEKDLKESFETLFKNAEENDVVCFLFLIDIKNLNFQKLKISLNDNKVIFYYYIPFFETVFHQNNLLLLGFKKNEIFFFDYFLKNFKYIDNYEKITEYLIKNVIWEKTDLYNHYLYWSNDSQIIVSSFLDFLCGGLVTLLPKTWKN